MDCELSSQSDQQIWANNTAVFTNCDASNSSISFNYGIFGSALTNDVVSSAFIKKYFYCLWWGLQNLRYDLVWLLVFLHIKANMEPLWCSFFSFSFFFHFLKHSAYESQHMVFFLVISPNTPRWACPLPAPKKTSNMNNVTITYSSFGCPISSYLLSDLVRCCLLTT